VDDDDPMKAAGREIAAAARAVVTGVTVAARAKAERRGERHFEEARRLEARAWANRAWAGVERRDRPHEVEAGVAERRRWEAHREGENVGGSRFRARGCLAFS
jgi:hypothetical protein